MKIFKVQKYLADTCGNRWSDNPPEYFRAQTLTKVIEKFGKVTSYITKDKSVSSICNKPKLENGYYIYPVNTEFNFERDKDEVLSVEVATGLGGYLIEELKIRELAS